MFDAASLSLIGGRRKNQDSVYHVVVGGILLAVVADGVGAYENSETASKTAVETVADNFIKDVNIGQNVLNPDYAINLISLAHSAIRAKNKFHRNVGCTTLALVISDGDTTIISHVGDTRIYLVEEGKISFETRDHSLAQAHLDSGKTKLNVRDNPNRNTLTRVVGGEISGGADTVVHTRKFEQNEGILVMTDGWWEPLSDEEIAWIFDQNATAEGVISSFKAAIEHDISPNHDNYSAIAVKIL